MLAFAQQLKRKGGRMQVYVWARRHQYVTLSFLGIFTFTAPYLPWVLLAFSVVLHSSPVLDLMGMLAGLPHFCMHCLRSSHSCSTGKHVQQAQQTIPTQCVWHWL